MVQCALEHGVKPAARAFYTSPQTVRLWLRRYKAEGLAGLKARSNKPRRAHPQTTPAAVEARIVALRHQHPGMGQDRIAKWLKKEGVTISGKTVGKILRKHGLIAGSMSVRRSPPLRGRALEPFEEVQIDVKDLAFVACGCGPQIASGSLPRYEFVLRDVATGASFVAYARALSDHNVTCFAYQVLAHLGRYGLKPRVIHVVDGSAWLRHKLDQALVDFWRAEGVLPSLLDAGSAEFTWSVATFQQLIDREFYQGSSFADEADLLEQARTFEHWFNLERYDKKRKGSPLELATRKRSDLTPIALAFEPLCLDDCLCKGG
jgi:hypothetical protein